MPFTPYFETTVSSSVRTALTFYAPLVTSLVPPYANGSGTPTFTRATTAYQTDFEGKLNAVLSGEARFQGARRVQNLISTTSEDFTNAAWLKVNATVAAPSVDPTPVTGPTGVANAYAVTFPAVSGAGKYSLLSSPAFQPTTVAVTPAIWLKNPSGASTIWVYINNGADSHAFQASVTTSWQRFSILGNMPNTTAGRLYIGGADPAPGGIAAQTVHIAMAQVEWVGGQSNQNPSEYVSVGVLSDPFHGANVDGVKYFDTLNGNTVASNVVTEATGAAIVVGASGVAATAPVDASGPFGYLAEGARENKALQSQTFNSTTWGKEQVSESSNQYVAPDGTVTMDKFTVTAGNAAHYTNQPFTFTAVPWTLSAYIRYVNLRWAQLNIFDGTTSYCASFDVLNGVVGLKHASATSTITPTAIAGVYRITVTATPLASAGAIQVYFANADSATPLTWNAAGTEITGVWGVQSEAASFASSYIPTTTVAVTRNADVLTYALANNIDATKGSAYAEVASAWTGTSALRHDIVSSASGTPLYVEASAGKLSINDGAAALGDVFTGAATVQKVGSTWGGAAANTYIAGTASADLAFDGDMSMTTALHIGDNNGGTQWDGTIRNVRIWGRALPDSTLISLTA